MELYDKTIAAVDFIRANSQVEPHFCINLGTGLTNVLSEEVDVEVTIPYHDLPHFPLSTVEGHRGELVMGSWGSVPVAFLSGRMHYYEGYSLQEVTFPVRVLSLLGVQHFLFTNVAGGLSEDYNAGDIVWIHDHINMLPDNPLRGYNDERFGPRFPDMSEVYDLLALESAQQYCVENILPFKKGIYYCLQGPSLETPAEYESIYRSGASLVGMSTVPEVIVAKHMGAKVNAVSIVSNVCYPKERITKTTLEDVIEVASMSSPNLIRQIRRIVMDSSKS